MDVRFKEVVPAAYLTDVLPLFTDHTAIRLHEMLPDRRLLAP